MTTRYEQFLLKKSQGDSYGGFDPVWMPDFLFPFQRSLVEWAIHKGKAALFADCGLGKTPMQLVWAENVVRHTGQHVLILTPLAVGPQTIAEATKFGITATRSRDGSIPAAPGIVVTNYERLHLFKPTDFAGVVCDESSILKHFTGATQKGVTRFMAKIPYRLLCTATAAPNDYVELGTSAEALGELGYTDMLSRFFKQTDNKPHRCEEVNPWLKERDAKLAGGNHFAKLAFRVSQGIGQWRLKGHAQEPFWRWVASWARAVRKPSDLGCDDDGFILPPLVEREHVVEPHRPPEGMLFTLPAFGLREERDERRRTLAERCQQVADLIRDDDGCSLVWCHLNVEGDTLEHMIPSSVQVRGADSDEYKERAVAWFIGTACICSDPLFGNKTSAGNGGCACGHKSGRRVLISKSAMFGWGLNLQCCNHVVTFITHSFESYYQSIRRCWRFGQTKPVTVDIVATVGEARVVENLHRKQAAAELMFAELVGHMHDAMRLTRHRDDIEPVQEPLWA